MARCKNMSIVQELMDSVRLCSNWEAHTSIFRTYGKKRYQTFEERHFLCKPPSKRGKGNVQTRYFIPFVYILISAAAEVQNRHRWNCSIIVINLDLIMVISQTESILAIIIIRAVWVFCDYIIYARYWK